MSVCVCKCLCVCVYVCVCVFVCVCVCVCVMLNRSKDASPPSCVGAPWQNFNILIFCGKIQRKIIV